MNELAQLLLIVSVFCAISIAALEWQKRWRIDD